MVIFGFVYLYEEKVAFTLLFLLSKNMAIRNPKMCEVKLPG